MDLPRLGEDIIIRAPATALNDHPASGLEAALYAPEHSEVVLDPMQAGEGGRQIKLLVVAEVLGISQLKP